MRTVSALVLTLLSTSAFASPVVVDANNRVVGFYLGATLTNDEQAVSEKGFRFSFRRAAAAISMRFSGNVIRFDGPNCTGAIRVADEEAPGFVTWTGTFGQLIYVAQDAQSEQRTSLSVLDSSGDCVNSNVQGSVYPAALNDPSITGIPSRIFPAPLRILSAWLFRDGFELISA